MRAETVWASGPLRLWYFNIYNSRGGLVATSCPRYKTKAACVSAIRALIRGCQEGLGIDGALDPPPGEEGR